VPALASARNPIDAFIRARLAKEGLQPSPAADRRTLLRRVTLDLTGLAPEPAQIEAFVKDKSADASEKVVDRLLASQAYAEHQAVPWLDAVRYADSAGYHSDGERPAWPYRDYVLRALLNNKPFDEFTREQLAGDLMPNATPEQTSEQKIASAYNRMGRTSAEGGLQPKEYWAKYGADRARHRRQLAGQHLRLRRVSRPQVRSDPYQRFLFHEGLLRRHQGRRPSCRHRPECL
jgi:hypothetical protein